MTNVFRGLWTIDCMITKFDSTSNRHRTEYSDVRFGSCVTNTVRGRKEGLRGRNQVLTSSYRKADAAIIFMEKPCGIYAARLSRLGAGL
jgi:hypothetical protein